MSDSLLHDAVQPTASPFRLTLADGRTISLVVDEKTADLMLEGRSAVRLSWDMQDEVSCQGPLGDELPPELFLPFFAHVFSKRGRPEQIAVRLEASGRWTRDAVQAGVFQLEQPEEGGVRLIVERGAFWQHPLMWLVGRSGLSTPLAYVMTGDKRHPRRSPKPTGEVYRRHMSRLGSTFSVRAIDLDRDLEVFNRWMNMDSVAHFWGERGSLDEHRGYLERMLADPHQTSMVGCFDDEPFAYFEIYWAKEDRISPFYDVDDYDRGVHLLVGDPRHQGPRKVEAWFRALAHYLFLDDPRTRRVVGDPRIDHVRWIEYMQKQGFVRLKTFDLPHKRSELIFIERETFFGQPWGGIV